MSSLGKKLFLRPAMDRLVENKSAEVVKQILTVWRWKSPHMIHHLEDWIVTIDPDLAKAIEEQGWLIEVAVETFGEQSWVGVAKPWHDTSLL